MPGMDGTGPLGQGPVAGGGVGRCGRGRGFGRIRGNQSGYAATNQYAPLQHNPSIGPEPECENELTNDEPLAAELHALKEESAALEKKVSELTRLVEGLHVTESHAKKKSDKSPR